MDERDRSQSPSRRTSRVEQVVVRWLRRSRESSSRERVLGDGPAGDVPLEPRSCAIRLMVQVPRSPLLNSHGFSVTTNTPLQVHEVTTGGPADGKLVTGDHLLQINNVAVDDLSTEQAADIIRECQDTITMTILRNTVGPKSSFITPEKRAKLKSNPVKVHFAEEVMVNGHSQGNSLLFLPNVLKVYLENGQTKAFKFDPKTTVKDIVLTLKEKLSITRIEHFSLVLEQQYSITKLLLLHEDEHIQEVVQKKESHECRCLFRVCFMPRDPEDLLDEDPVAFEYLYLQCVSDVLQERYAIEMKCNTALRLAALHIQERLASCGQSPKTPIKTITRDWGIENFVSSTLLRNMREKDLRKAISYHMKKSVVLEPKQKLMSVNQARLSYLSEMAELRSYGGRSFSATMMLQDRESMVSLLVGAQCGVSQVINHKLSIMNVLTEFSSITRIELVPESDRVSLVKIYLQDIKPITLLLETGAARELSCLLAGYCRLLVDPQSCVFPWPSSSQGHRISAEEGYVSRCGSESDDSDTDVDALLAHVANVARGNVETLREREEHKTGEDTEKEEEERSQRQTDGGTAEKDDQTEKGGESFRRTGVIVKDEEEGETADKGKTSEEREERKEEARCFVLLEEPTSEASDSCQSDSRVLASVSSDSMDALEEDDLLSFCSATRPCHLAVEHSYRLRDIERLTPSPLHHHYADISFNGHPHLDDYPGDIEGESFLCFAALSQIAECLPSPPEASDEDEDEEEGDGEGGIEGSGTSPHRPGECVFTFEQGDARRYYNICSSVTPDSARSLPLSLSPPVPPKQEDGGGEGEAGRALEPTPILQPPPGFGDSSSDDEFFDAQDRFLSPEQPSSAAMTRENSTESSSMKRTLSLSDIGVCMAEQMIEEGEEQNQKDVEVKTDRAERWSGPSRFQKRPRKRRSFMETDFTSLVSFPGPDTDHPSSPIPNHSFGCNGSGKGEKVNGKQGSTLSAQSPCPTVLSMTHAETEPSELESKSISQSKAVGSGNHRPDGSSRTGSNSSTATQRKQQQMEMEPDSMEFKSVTEHMAAASPSIVAVRSRTGPCENDSNSVRDGADLDDQGSVEGLVEQIMANHLFFELPARQEGNYSRLGGENDQPAKGQTEGLSNSFQCDSAPQLGQTAASSLPSLQIPTISLSPIHPGSDRIDAFVRGETQRFPVEPPERIRSQSLSATLGRAAPYRTRSMVRTRGLESQGPDGSDPAQWGPGQRGPPGVPGVEPGSVFLLAPCSSGLLGRLSASTLRGKIQSLPLYLSRSQETIAANANAKPERRFSDTRPRRNEVEVAREATEDPSACEVLPEVTEVKVVTIMSEEVTEVIEEVREVCHVCPQTQIEPELQEEPQDIPKEPSSSSPLQSEADANFKLCPPSVVVTTQNLNGPWSMARAGEFSPLQGGSCPHGCGRFANCEPRPTKTQPQSHGLCLRTKPNLGCSSVLTLGCETALEGVQTPLEVCGCQSVYTNCFSGVLDSTFDDELTVYEFSCQTQQQGNAGDSPLMCIPPSSFSPSPSSLSPSSAFPTFPQVLTQSSSTELSPLLSPLDVPDCFLSDSQEDSIATLLARRHPSAPTGFLTLQRDVDILLSVLAGAVRDQEGLQREQEHPKDSCASHFSVNKHRLHVGARGLLAGCQRVVRARQTPEETLQALVESFQSLVQLTGACLCFSSCSRCRERHAQVHTGLVDVLHTYREFARIAEHVGSSTGGRSCHDLSIKLLARQCTSLTTSVFCLTQLFRTLTAL